MIDKKLQIFISSTSLDLREEREAAILTILKAGHIPGGMEIFTSDSKTPLEIIKKWIDESDIYMIILGGRYGSVEPASGLSYTEIEYHYAVERSKPTFAIVASQQYIDSKAGEQPEPGNDLLIAFRRSVTAKYFIEFNEIRDIKYAILESLFFIQSNY